MDKVAALLEGYLKNGEAELQAELFKTAAEQFENTLPPHVVEKTAANYKALSAEFGDNFAPVVILKVAAENAVAEAQLEDPEFQKQAAAVYDTGRLAADALLKALKS